MNTKKVDGFIEALDEVVRQHVQSIGVERTKKALRLFEKQWTFQCLQEVST